MRFMDEFRDPHLARGLVDEIRREARRLERVTFMEVCGTHTMSIFRHGIRGMLPPNVRLLSGPGCPVCVTPNGFLDRAIAYGRHPGVILATFGDMMRVPGSASSLERERAAGRDVRVVYSPLDALQVARENPKQMVVFLGVGFETTAPTIAASMLEARRRDLDNYTVLAGHKLVPPAMEAVVKARQVALDGFICPPHVSAIIGTRPYEPLVARHGIPCVITGFEPLDILQGILMLMRQVGAGAYRVENQYSRVVAPEGNRVALALLESVFDTEDSLWRGIGPIPKSGLKIRESLAEMDITRRMPVAVEPPREEKGCRCGDVLRGVLAPPQCGLFGRRCTPEHPVGACMVSGEGTCAAYFKYQGAGTGSGGVFHE
jgi:hydrogenase expression/formation protein HypD